MAIKKYKPTTPGQRFKEISSYDELTPGAKPEKSLLKPIKKSGGRNNTGKMTMRYLGGGHKKRYRLIDFKRDKDNMEATVKSIEYDPNRSARIALVVYTDGEKRYIIAPEKLKVGQKIVSGEKVAPELGNTLSLANIPLGTDVHNIELKPGKGGMLARSAGAYGTLTSRDGKYAIIKLPSGESRMVLTTCRATIGVTSNGDHGLEKMPERQNALAAVGPLAGFKGVGAPDPLGFKRALISEKRSDSINFSICEAVFFKSPPHQAQK